MCSSYQGFVKKRGTYLSTPSSDNEKMAANTGASTRPVSLMKTNLPRHPDMTQRQELRINVSVESRLRFREELR